MKPTDEQMKELLEWTSCKLICSPEKDQYKRGIWETPDGLRIDQPDFNSLESLPFLFKHAVPKALKIIAERGFAPPIMKLFQLWCDKLVTIAGDSSDTQYAALALFWVIHEIMEAVK